jgi:hypothetical protein
MAAKKSKSGGSNYRSSKTGRYTTKKAADRSPSTHEKERRKRR